MPRLVAPLGVPITVGRYWGYPGDPRNRPPVETISKAPLPVHVVVPAPQSVTVGRAHTFKLESVQIDRVEGRLLKLIAWLNKRGV